MKDKKTESLSVRASKLTTSVTGRHYTAFVKGDKLVLSIKDGYRVSPYILKKITKHTGIDMVSKFSEGSFSANTADCKDGFSELVFRAAV